MKNGWFGRISNFVLCLVLVVSVVGGLDAGIARADDRVLGKDNAGSITFTLYAGEYAITQDKEGLDVVQMEGFSSTTSPGDPMLPHKVYDIAVPPDTVWSSLKLHIVSAEISVLEGTYDVRPAGPDVAWSDDKPIEDWGHGKDIVNGKNMEVYETDADFPESCLALLPYSQMRKWKYTRVDFTPLQYNPVSQKLTLIQSVTIRIGYEQSGIEPQASLMNDTAMDDVAAQILFNYQQAKSMYKPGAISDAASVTYDYVIITTNAIEASSTKLASFISHKGSQGHSVLVITEDEFGSLIGQSPNHKAEKIRKWLIDNYAAMGIEYVLLIGDPHPYESTEGDIPMKMCWPRRGEATYQESPTDYFYADLTGNWDYDGDEYYGEWTDDYPVPGGVDFAPEVYVGRIPVYGAAYSTLDSILQKIIDYETEASIGWRESTLLPMGFQGEYAGEKYDGAPLAEQMRDDYLNAAGFSSWRMYQQGNGACGLDSIYTSEEELRGGTVLRDRWAASDYGVVCWWGHGSATSTSVGYDGCWDGTLFRNSYCSSLDDEHPSFTYQCSCTNGYPEHSDNLQYAILKQGGIGTVSATRVSWFNAGVGYGEFDGSSTNSGIGYEYVSRLVSGSRAGQALYSTKQTITPLHQCSLMNWYDFNLYGDPTTSLASQGGEPDITVFPISFDVTLPPETSQNYTLTIGNVGDAELAYTISDKTTGGGGPGGAGNLLLEPASQLLEIPLAGDVVEPEEAGPSGWQNIMTEDFEGAFPGVWDLWVAPGATDAYWGKDSYNPHTGLYSAFCAKSGTAGVDPPADYPNNMEAWMIYGPFSLADATDAELNFYCWVDTEYGYDYLKWMASINGQDFYGWIYSGNSGGWVSQSFDLTDVYTLGNLCGQTQVWIAFIFQSDFMIVDDGAFVDDIELRKYLGAANNPPNIPSSPSPANHATGVSIDSDLSWTGGDPDPGDTVTYDVYFDTTGATTQVSNDQSGTTYDPGTLSNNTTYYWKIEATDNHEASTSGPIWDFTTAGAVEDCPWLDENPKSGTVEPGGSDNITVSINTAGLGSDYTAEIVIASNDPDEDPTLVPVTLHVGAQAPTVTTNGATLVEETTATLNGVVSDDAGEACHYRFGYGTTQGGPYTYTTWSVDTRTTGGSFSQPVSTLNKGTKYYFIAQAKNSAGTGSGSELTFLTKPDAPTSFDATTAGSTQIDLSWAKGDGAQKTKVQRKEGSYPTNRDDGTQVYFDAGTGTSDTGLSQNTTYYYRAWSCVEGSEQWSDECDEDWATTTEEGTTGVLYLDPSGSSASYCHSAQVEIRVNTGDDGIEINGGSINLTYDVECANVTDVAFDDMWDVTAWDSHTPGQEKLGFLIVAENLDPGDYPVATLTIHCVNDSIEGCQTDLLFPQGTMLTNMAGQEICPEVEDGTFTCVPCTCGDTNCDADHKVNIADASLLFSNVILPDYPICCAGCDEWCGNVNCLGEVNIADASLLFSHVILGSVQYPVDCCQPTQALLKASSEVEQGLLYLDPGDSSAPPCNTTEFEIRVNTEDDGIEINGGSINLTYDAECANVTDVAFDDMWAVTAWDSDTPGQEKLGFLIVAENLAPGDYPVATLTIHCVNDSIEGCQTDLLFAQGTMLTNMAGQEICPEVEDGTFQCCTPDNPPNMPSDPSPANHATGVSVYSDLSWSGGDPDPGDTVTYDVYIGSNPTPPLIETIGPYAANQTYVSYGPGALSYNTTYYWQIVARDDHGVATEGPVWDFTTRGDITYLDLVEGCNIICYPGASATLATALTNIGPTGLDLVEIIWARAAWTNGDWWFYNVAQDHSVPAKFTHLENGRAYLIVVSEDCSWELL